ncbi:MAG: GNAT family N-acetyltransferase, partial [Candidatus Dormiibacterota bacterium]
SLCFGALDRGGQLGFARIVTDRATFAWLCDVFVSPAARGRGIGRRLLDAVAAHPDLQTVRRILLATRDAHRLYARHGFQPLAEPARWMERYGER